MDISPGRALREAAAEETLLVPGAANALVGRLIESAGLRACYLSGEALSTAVLGMPDVGLFTLSELAQQAAYLTRGLEIPVIVDAAAGFGGPAQVRRSVVELEAAGAAAIQLSDRQWTSSDGDASRVALVETDAMCDKLRAAAAARRDRDLVLIARTEARPGAGLEAALDRARRYVRAGADWILPHGLANREEYAAFAREIEAPLIASLSEFADGPPTPYDALAELEYAAVLYPLTLLRVGMRAMEAALHVLVDEGSPASLLDLMQSDEDLDELLGAGETEE